MSTKNKKQLGAFYTTGVDKVLKEFEHIVSGRNIVDLYCGDRHLLEWGLKHGATKALGYDMNKDSGADIIRNTLVDVPNVRENAVVVINPPYLLRNKAEDKTPFDLYETTDLYKASLLSLIINGTREAIIIVPSNIFMDNDDNFRTRFYANFEIKKVVMFDKRMFEDTNVRVAAFHIVRGTTTKLFNHSLHNTKIGKSWFNLLENNSTNVKRLIKGDIEPLNFINLRTTDTGSDGGEIKLFIGEHYYGKSTDRNLATIIFDKQYSKKEQKQICSLFNSKLDDFRNKYDSMFLTNFLAGGDGKMRKRISFRDAYKLINSITKEI